jgi:hypothetical protein
MCHVMNGAANQRRRTGDAAGRPAGRASDRYPNTTAASAGATHIFAHAPDRPRLARCRRSLDGVHSRRRLRVTSVLATVRRAASRLKKASYGRHASDSIA